MRTHAYLGLVLEGHVSDELDERLWMDSRNPGELVDEGLHRLGYRADAADDYRTQQEPYECLLVDTERHCESGASAVVVGEREGVMTAHHDLGSRK